jgi:transcriptional regulator with XRE-family HTH domain
MAAIEFERVVRAAMDGADLSLSALARQSGVDRGRWYSWFRGENVPQSRTLTRAAVALGIDVDDLIAPFGGATSRVPPDPGLTALVTALQAQTAAITDLVADLRASLRGVERGLQAAARLREDASSEAPTEPRSRAGARR